MAVAARPRSHNCRPRSTSRRQAFDKRFWICGILVSIAAMLLDFVVHGWLLQGDYNALVASGIMRTPEDAQHYMPYMLAAHLLIGFGLTWLYRKGIDSGRPSDRPGPALRRGGRGDVDDSRLSHLLRGAAACRRRWCTSR